MARSPGGIDPAETIAKAVACLRERGFDGRYACAMVLGTGLGGLADELEDAVALPFAEIPGFPRPGVSGHGGRLVAGRLAGRRVLVLQGRVHFYEGGDAAAMRVPIGAVAALGAPPLLLTNASGAVRADWPTGTLVLLSDHINFAGTNPLIGDASEARFVPMVGAYDAELAATMRRAATAASVPLQEGVYMWFSGPSFETPAEIRAARVLGADLVGMSTVPEVILARYYGLRVAALSLVTNPAAGIVPGAHTHADTKAAGRAAEPDLRRLVTAFVADLPDVSDRPL
jgi:purine-nucleoside phosphorylase